MRLNNKGFTVIESVITFMIIVIAGSMLIVGVFNIVNIFSESSVIKGETNRLFNELVNESNTIKPGTDNDMTFVFDDGTESIAAYKDYYVEVENPIIIKLFAFNPAKKAEMLPGESEQPEEPEVIGEKGRFMYLTNPKAVPYDFLSFSEYGNNASNYTSDIFDSLFKKEVHSITGFFIYGENVREYLANAPTDLQFENAYNRLPDNYKKSMGLKSYEESRLVYDGIIKTANPNDLVEIYTHFVPNRKGLLLKYRPTGQVNNFAFVWCDIVEKDTGFELILPINLGDMANNKFTVKLKDSTKEYTHGHFTQCSFIGDNAKLINGYYYAEAL